jgi:hypothetical protein
VIISGLQLRGLYPSDWQSTCDAAGTCNTIGQSIRGFDKNFQTLFDKLFLFLLPAITGVFWGAPLVARELESGTFRLAWTQSVSRTRWLGTKVAIVGLGSLAASALLSLMVTWWFGPIDSAGGTRFEPLVFSLRDIVPVSYAAFAFAVGVTASVLIRRTLPAMATTLFVYIVARVVVQNWVRPHFQTPLQASAPFRPTAKSLGSARSTLTGGVDVTKPGDWVVSSKVLDPAGHVANQVFTASDPCTATNTCFDGFRYVVTYQPADRYWTFQWYETSIFAGLALVLIGACFGWLRRRHA